MGSDKMFSSGHQVTDADPLQVVDAGAAASNAAIGTAADAVVDAGAVGTLSAKLRRLTQGLEDLKTQIVIAAGTALIGKVGIDQTTPGTTNRVSIAETYIAGHQRVTNNAASQALTVPAMALACIIVAEGGDVRYAPTGAASATSPGYIPAGCSIKVPPPAAVYGAAGTYANVIYLL